FSVGAQEHRTSVIFSTRYVVLWNVSVQRRCRDALAAQPSHLACTSKIRAITLAPSAASSGPLAIADRPSADLPRRAGARRRSRSRLLGPAVRNVSVRGPKHTAVQLDRASSEASRSRDGSCPGCPHG